MLRKRIIINKLVSRTLKSASSQEVINKPKKTWWHNDYIKFPYMYSFDRPRHYLDLNSRLITVEGNIAVGKEKVAKKIADYFALQYIEDVNEDELHIITKGKKTRVDLREYNTLLPRTARCYTREMLWTDDNPIKYGKPLLLQLHHYYWRYYNICKGMAHLLNTGKGMVSNRSPFADNVMALALMECGLMSEPAYKYYNLIRCETLPDLWRPNIIVYLKASPELIRKKLKEKNGWDQNARNITDQFIETYTDILENKYLKGEEAISKIFTIDLDKHNIDDDDDFIPLMDSMAKLNKEFKGVYDFDSLHLDWRNGTHGSDITDFSRVYFSSAKLCFSKVMFVDRIPFALREGAYSEDELAMIKHVLNRDDRLLADYNTKYESLKNIIFKKPKFNYENPDHSPTDVILQSYL